MVRRERAFSKATLRQRASGRAAPAGARRRGPSPAARAPGPARPKPACRPPPQGRARRRWPPAGRSGGGFRESLFRYNNGRCKKPRRRCPSPGTLAR